MFIAVFTTAFQLSHPEPDQTVYTLPKIYLRISLELSFHLSLGPINNTFFSCFTTKNIQAPVLLSHACHMAYPSRCTLFCHTDDFWCIVYKVKTLTVQLPPVPCTSSTWGSFISFNIFNNQKCQVKFLDPNENSLICIRKTFCRWAGLKIIRFGFWIFMWPELKLTRKK